ncbi:hypothetical protein CHU98_g9794 [Xylaria longipes]|nr:hypothetical protein CHU98_g9794 [Xylaria longipes]
MNRPSGRNYKPRLKDLVVMLAKKYQCNNSLSDLQEAILSAQEMVGATPLGYPNNSARGKDSITMILMKLGCTDPESWFHEYGDTFTCVVKSLETVTSSLVGLTPDLSTPLHYLVVTSLLWNANI